MDISKLLFSPVGRIGRQTYWTALVLLAGAAMMLGFVPFFGPLVALVVLWPMACIVTKRLHDADRAAWAVPLVVLLCAASGVLSFAVTLMTVDPAHAIAAFGLAGLAVIVGGFALLAAVLLFVLAGMPRGTRAANRFGPPEAWVLTFAALLRATRL